MVLMKPLLPPSITLMRLLPESAMNTLPLLLDAHTPQGKLMVALVAAPPSPLKESVPVPAKVLRAPVLPDTLRTVLPYCSVMYKSLVAATKNNPKGKKKVPDVACAWSADPRLPVPAYVEMKPVLYVTFRILLFWKSAINRLPAVSPAK
jgi:hypothetical protein